MSRSKNDKASKKKKSSYFGYACKISYDLRSLLDNEKLKIEDFMLLDDSFGSLAIKLFVKYLDDAAIAKFSKFAANNKDNFEQLREKAKSNEKLARKLEKLAVLI